MLLLLVVATGVAAQIAWRTFQARLQPVNPSAENDALVVTIPPGAATTQIAGLLAEHQLIQDPRVFVLYARWQQLSDRLQAGEYELSPSMDVGEIVDRLVRGQVVTYSLTIPEGFTVSQVIEAAVNTGLFEEDDLRQALDEAAEQFPYLPDDLDVPEPLEGYLFPDTYLLTRSVDSRALVNLMLQRFETEFNEDWRRRAEELGMTVHEVVTLASIIERETPVDAERPIVAGVFHNRLKIGMMLQADPTVRYAMGRWEGPVLNRDLELDSPYNTYRYGGLPPGPIASPGATALEAALQPADVDYLYFVSRYDGSGEHVFARTYNEHLRNIRQYRP